jgi:hypothetical protein
MKTSKSIYDVIPELKPDPIFGINYCKNISLKPLMQSFWKIKIQEKLVLYSERTEQMKVSLESYLLFRKFVKHFLLNSFLD